MLYSPTATAAVVMTGTLHSDEKSRFQSSSSEGEGEELLGSRPSSLRDDVVPA